MTNWPDHDPHGTASDSRDCENGAAPIDVLTRWELFGGTWHIIARTGHHVTISLCRCDGGEEQQRLTSDDPALIGWLGDRTSSAAPAPDRPTSHTPQPSSARTPQPADHPTPGSSTIRSAPELNASGPQVIASTARLRRRRSEPGSK